MRSIKDSRHFRREVPGWMSVLLMALFLVMPDISNAAGRAIEFSGRTWLVKNGAGLGPGPNDWSDKNVWVDPQGYLHLKIARGERDHEWRCAEVSTQEPAPHGVYHFYLIGKPSRLDKNVVLGLALYRSDSQEVDIEFSQWSGEVPPRTVQYVIQPAHDPGHMIRFPMRLIGDLSIHSIDWQPSYVGFRSVSGDTLREGQGNLIRQWKVDGGKVPEMDAPRLHINLWLDRGRAPSDGREVEMIIARVAVEPTLKPRLFKINSNIRFERTFD